MTSPFRTLALACAVAVAVAACKKQEQPAPPTPEVGVVTATPAGGLAASGRPSTIASTPLRISTHSPWICLRTRTANTMS